MGYKFGFLTIALLLIFAVAAGYVMIKEIEAGVKATATQKALSDLTLGYEYIDLKYPGEWNVRDGELFKGNVRMNENFALVDDIGKFTGDTVTIFLGDTRIATNVQVDGKRAVGTQVSATVADKVLKQGELYLGEANVVGKNYQTAYQPIKNAQNETIGIWYVGAPQNMIDQTVASATRHLLFTVVVVILLAIVIVFFFIRNINSRLNKLLAVFCEAGEGNFQTHLEVTAKDEIGNLSDSYNHMKENLRSLVQQILTLSHGLAASSTQLAASSEQTIKGTELINTSIEIAANGAEQQTVSVDHCNDSMDTINIDIQRVVSSMAAVAGISNATSKDAELGNQSIQKTMSQMSQVSSSVEHTVTIIQSLEERSKDIENIVSVITGIAAQTNLLALNASIEAARAGEHGRGFAVVAEEVRKLAEQSEISAKQITELIGQVQSETLRSVKAMNTVATEVTTGTVLVEEAKNNFQKIAQASHQIAAQIQEVTNTSETLSKHVRQVASSINEISEIARTSSSSFQEVAAATEEQQAAIEEISASATSLNEMAEELETAVLTFKI
ncbi:hypothetical protein BHU72_04545 [Desulfuribacillus stibiiarsenatis]|uniref:Chemotaxis protein n=2 Tax=Desulfuribacillus stibiiarsenatis TaxID=1390249 RepID=A0A1E5L5Y7_9FIRM|nr:hypothetical protein BHU72_04545 [Desulfuribacillus stibiiarsenatis]